MLLRLPRGLHYPITVTKVLKKAGSIIVKHEPLFLYTYETTVREGSRNGEDKYVKKAFPAKFESGLEGQLKFWKVLEGDVLAQPVDVAEIEEECAHSEQFAGMCTNCGKDMTIVSSHNNDANDADRAPFQTSHDTQMLRISQREASRREEEAKIRLLASRKLSLVVDLDQTIIHAAVDPTIAEWQKDKDNPNYEAVKDVRTFQLIDDGPGMRGCWYYIKLRPGLKEFLEQVSQSYELHIYTMGTRQYAEQIANIVDPDRKYFGDRILSRDESGSMTNKNLERLFPIDTKMVVIIDDRGDVWKWNANLVRVIPFDFFVGIGDINSSFLPKKQEITSLPLADKPEDAKPEHTDTNGQDTASKSDERSADGAEKTASNTTDGNDASALEQLVAMGGGDDPVIREIQSKGQEETIAAQLEDKPLLQMQRLLDAKDEEEAAAAAAAEDNYTTTNITAPNGDTMEPKPDSVSPSPASEPTELTSTPPSTGTPPAAPKPSPPRHSLLRDDDRELTSLTTRLQAIHTAFYTEYDLQRLNQKGGRVAALSAKGRKMQLQPSPSTNTNDTSSSVEAASSSSSSSSCLLLVPDIKTLLPSMKSPILAGVVIVFSGVLPLETDVQTADISLWAKTFGATITEKVIGGKGRKGKDGGKGGSKAPAATHVVAARAGTSKVKQGWRRELWVVRTQWLVDCLTGWRRMGEEGYVLQPLGGAERKVVKGWKGGGGDDDDGGGGGGAAAGEGGGGDERKDSLDDLTTTTTTTNHNSSGFLLSSDEGEADADADGDGETTGIDTEAETENPRKKRPGAAPSSSLDAPQPDPKRLRLTTANLQTPDNEDDPGVLVNGFIQDASPLSINQDEWADMDKELREFIGSDGSSSSSSDESESEAVNPGGGNKRKRQDEADETAETDAAPWRRRRLVGKAPDIVVEHDPEPEPEPDPDTLLRRQQIAIENAEREEEAEQLSSDDELARELEREFENEGGSSEDEEGFMALGAGGKDADGGGGGGGGGEGGGWIGEDVRGDVGVMRGDDVEPGTAK